jgi:hypothetical protein
MGKPRLASQRLLLLLRALATVLREPLRKMLAAMSTKTGSTGA